MPRETLDHSKKREGARLDIVRRLWRGNVRKYKSRLLTALTAAAVYSLVTLSIPPLFKYIIDVILPAHDSLKFLLVMLALLIGLLIRSTASYLRTRMSAAVAFSTCTDLRVELFAHLQRLSYSYFDKSRTGDIMSRITNDVITLQHFILNSLEDFFIAPVMVAGGLVILFALNWQLAGVVLVTCIVVGILLRFFGKPLRRVNDAIQRRGAEITTVLSESIGTIRVVQSFGREDDQVREFEEVARKNLSEQMRAWRISAVLLPTVELMGLLAPLIIISISFWGYMQGISTFGDFFAVAGMAALVINPLNKLSRVFVTLHQGTSAAERIFQVLDEPIAVRDKPGASELDSVDGHIVFENVNFEYHPGEEVLKNFSLEISPGKTVALVGGSGCGKTTVVNLIPRFYEPTSGRITIDGHEIRDVTLKSLRDQIGIVSQENILIHGTLRENIRFGRPEADEAELIDAAMNAGAHRFIMEFPDGYDTIVGERGVTLSGGERQRIAIARALLKDPRILILDEATAAMDTITEAQIQDALNKLMFGRTTIVVAHRLSTIRNADRIIVLKAGRIAEEGTHDELMALGGEYAELQSLYGRE